MENVSINFKGDRNNERYKRKRRTERKQKETFASVYPGKGNNRISKLFGLFILAFFAVLIQASQEELESRVFFFGKLKEGGFSFGAAVILAWKEASGVLSYMLW